MAMKKTTNPVRPGQGQPGGPPNPSSMKFSPGVTVLGQKILGDLQGRRAPLTSGQLAQLKAMIAKANAEKAKAVKDAKKNKKIIKKQDKKPLVTGRGPTKPITTTNTTGPKKPIIKITGRPGLRGGFGGSGGLFGTKNK
jgi:hypothetical protein